MIKLNLLEPKWNNQKHVRSCKVVQVHVNFQLLHQLLTYSEQCLPVIAIYMPQWEIPNVIKTALLSLPIYLVQIKEKQVLKEKV